MRLSTLIAYAVCTCAASVEDAFAPVSPTSIAAISSTAVNHDGQGRPQSSNIAVLSQNQKSKGRMWHSARAPCQRGPVPSVKETLKMKRGRFVTLIGLLVVGLTGQVATQSTEPPQNL